MSFSTATTTTTATATAALMNSNNNNSKTTIMKQQQQKKDWNDDSSCHGCSTNTNVVVDNENFINDELLATTFRWMFWSPHHLVKDDVFFAPSAASGISTTSLIDSSINASATTNNWVPTPCLSPVTSPSDFLYDREPLFDGIYQEVDHHQHLNIQQQQVAEPAAIIYSSSSIIMRKDSSNNDIDDWSSLFNNDHYDFLPLTPSTTTTEEEEEEDEQDEDEEALLDDDLVDDDDEDYDYYEEEQVLVVQPQDTIFTTAATNGKKFQVMNQTASSTKQQQQKQNPLKRRINDESLLIYIPTTTSKKAKKSSSAASCSTVFENLTKMGIDWCRYCGTTEGVNWRPGPWGKRTLCNKHGCDYKGYGLASRLPRLDLSAFTKERIEDRTRPIVQQFCVICQSPEQEKSNELIPCEGGCSRAYHVYCHSSTIGSSSSSWYCSALCHENKQKNKVVVDLPRKYLPLMGLQQRKKSLKLSTTVTI